MAADHAIVKEVLVKELADYPGKEMLMITVEYSAGIGGSDPPARRARVRVCAGRHDRHAGRGGKEVTLKPGQSFYEGPNDVHTGRS